MIPERIIFVSRGITVIVIISNLVGYGGRFQSSVTAHRSQMRLQRIIYVTKVGLPIRPVHRIPLRHVATAPIGAPFFFQAFRITLRYTPQSVGLLWTSDQPEAETCTRQARSTYERQSSMPPAVFEPAPPASQRQQTHTLDRPAARIDSTLGIPLIIATSNFLPLDF